MSAADRELLEPAALAAGINVVWGELAECFFLGEECLQPWTPLDDDGDAFRLLHAIYRKSDVHHWIRIYDNLWGGSIEDTRRAIVRAAAEFGRAMP